MPIRIGELIANAKADVALEYARVEVARAEFRSRMAKEAGGSVAYFFSTEHKRHMSSLLYEAHQTGKPLKVNVAAQRLGISRQQASRILHEANDAGWITATFEGYRYSDELAAAYAEAVPDMLTIVEHELTRKLTKLLDLQEIASNYVALTGDDRSTTLTQEVING